MADQDAGGELETDPRGRALVVFYAGLSIVFAIGGYVEHWMGWLFSAWAAKHTLTAYNAQRMKTHETEIQTPNGTTITDRVDYFKADAEPRAQPAEDDAGRSEGGHSA